ncbi:hypothetical protein CcaverHIS631_0301530 [Cutaneotrichosporon cavernicola]|nr:hypothetical protein CcaverHIS631_0301530 [Cutaneotrichosporon cavernicola]
MVFVDRFTKAFQAIPFQEKEFTDTALSHDWDVWLPTIQYAYLITPQTTTGLAPYKVLYGIEPRTPLSRPRPETLSPEADRRFDEMKRVHDITREAIIKANDRHAHFFNRSIKNAPPYKVDDWVWLDRHYLRRARPSLKLDQQYYGPFQIKAATASPLVWELDLPPHLSQLHPRFHVIKLKPFHDANPLQWQEPPRPVVKGKLRGEEPEDAEYVVERITDSRVRQDGSANRQSDYQYLTAWLGYPRSADLWLPYEEVRDVQAFKEFATANIDNPDHVFPRNCRQYLGLPALQADNPPRPQRERAARDVPDPDHPRPLTCACAHAANQRAPT